MNTAVRYIRRLITGDFSQGQAFWAILIPIVLAIKATAELLSLFNIIQNPVISTRFWGAVAIFVILVFLPLIFFGCIRAIIIHSRQFKGGNESILLLLATAFTAYLCVSDVIKHADVFQSMAAIAFKQDGMSIEFLAKDEQTALISGQLTYNATQTFSKWLRQYPNVQTIELDIDAGHLHEARNLAKLIIKNKLDTKVTDRCAASCMLVLAAGKNRVVTENATLQFHRTKGYDNGYRSEWIMEKERQKDRSYYKSRGVDEGYLFPMFYKQTNDDYLTPSLDILLAYGVITAIH